MSVAPSPVIECVAKRVYDAFWRIMPAGETGAQILAKHVAAEVAAQGAMLLAEVNHARAERDRIARESVDDHMALRALRAQVAATAQYQAAIATAANPVPTP